MKFEGFILAAMLIFSGALAGCNLAPDYATPEMPTPQAFKEPGDWKTAQPSDEAARGPWWQMFADPQLNALEDKVTVANQDLKAALARYEEARAAASAAGAAYYPSVTGNTNATRTRQSNNTTNRPGIRYFNDFLLGANASYEIDLWGRVRNSVSAAKSEAQATKADAASVELSLHAELAADYFALRGDDALQKVLDKTMGVDQEALTLTRNRFKGGISPEADVDQAETQLQNVKTQAIDTRLQRAQLEHAIAVLTGQMPESFQMAPLPLGNVAPPSPDPGLPSTLLQRRPDIAAAERRTAEANANIGVARAAWFPTFSLTGTFGFESGSPATWLDAPSQFWTLGPSAVMTLFDAGRISALSDEAHAVYDEAAANYRQTVLSAYQEVEDNLAALHHLSDENKSQDAATAAAERALTQENYLYRGGAATYLDVAVSQNAALQAELASVNVRVRRMTASMQLIKALGGGWQAAQIAESAE